MALNYTELAANNAVRKAHDAVADAALECHEAGLDGTAVKDHLREASMALLALLAVLEGKS